LQSLLTVLTPWLPPRHPENRFQAKIIKLPEYLGGFSVQLCEIERKPVKARWAGRQKGVVKMLTRAIATILIAAMAIVALPKPTAYAGDKEWATAGKILAGVVGAAIIHEAVTSGHRDRHVEVHRRYPGRTVRRVRYVQSPKRYWVPGHNEIRTVRTWVEGYWEEVYVPPEYKRVRVTKYGPRGRTITVWKEILVREGYHEKIWHKGYWETHEVREWVPGYWEYR